MNEEELKKGCGNDWEDKYGEIHTCGRYVRVKLGKKGSENVLCPTCQARLEGFQKDKLEQKKEDKNKQDEFYNEFDLASNCSKDDKLFKKLWNKYFKQLQKEIGGMK